MANYNCPNLGDVVVKKQFDDLVEAFGEPLAYYIWHNATSGNIKIEKKVTPVTPSTKPQRGRLGKKDAGAAPIAPALPSQEVKEGIDFVFEPEQVHILGSKQDIEGFKEFISSLPIISALPSETIDFNKMSITSYSLGNLQKENAIVNSLSSFFLELVDDYKKEGKELTTDNIFLDVLDDLRTELEFFSYYSENDVDEDAISNGASEDKSFNKQRADNIQIVLNNFETIKNEDDTIKFVGYKERIINKIESLKYNVLDDFDSEEDILDRKSYEDGFMFKVDAESSISAQVKRMLSFVPKKLANGKTQPNALGYETYEDYAKVYSLIMNELTDVPINELHSTLKSLGERNQIAKDVAIFLDELEKTNPADYRRFHVVFRRQQANFVTVMATALPKDGLRSFRVIDTNRVGASDIVTDVWFENFKTNSPIVKMNEATGELSIDTEKGKELYKRFKDVLDKPFEEQVTAIVPLLNEVGIDVTVADMRRLNEYRDKANHPKNNKPNKYTRFFSKQKDFNGFLTNELSFIFSDLAGVTKQTVEETWQLFNPFHTQSSRIKGLAPYYLERNPEITSNSFKNGNGDTIQGNVMPHHASNRIEKVMNDSAYREVLKKIPFIRNASWLTQPVKMKYMDSSKMMDSKQDSKSYDEQTPTEKEYTKISLFQKEGKNSILIGNTPSDKTTFKMFETERHNVNFGKNTDVFDNGVINTEAIDLESPTMQLLYNILVQSEINRINAVRTAFNNYKDDLTKLIPGYHYLYDKSGKLVIGSGAYTFFIPELNSKLSEYVNSNGELVISPERNLELKKILRDKVVRLINDKVLSWNEKGIVDSKTGRYDFDKTYAAKIRYESSDFEKSQNVINTAAAEMVTNYMITYANEFMLVTGDPALFTKPNLKFTTVDDLISKTADNIFKRTAKDIAPGIEGLFDSTTFNTIFITEPKYDAEISKYTDRLGNIAEGYKNLDIADAQEWSTLKEHLNVLFAYGKISREVRNDLIAKAELRSIASENEKKQFNFTWAELGTVLQPIKPVYVSSKYKEELEVDVQYYIKTSSFPLIPQLTESLEIDKLRVAMEENSIDRAVVNSGVKTGYFNPVNIFSRDGGLNIPKNLRGFIHNLNRDGFRIQQEVPFDATKDSILEGSQVRKLKFANLTTDMSFNFNGNPNMKGYQLKEIDDAIHNRLYEMRYNDLLKELGIEQGNNTIEDVDKLKKLLFDSAKDLGYNINDLLLLNTIKLDNGVISFETPLYFHNESDRIESMLNSIIKNRVLKNKMKGKSYVQGSSVGFVTKTKVGTQEFLNEMLKLSQQSVVLTKDKNGKTNFKGELEYRKYVENGKEVIYGEVFAPFNFIREGVALKLEDYVDEFGFIKDDKLDSELLNILGYRIPTQGHSSMIKLKIVGFLPQEAGDLVIVPAAITKQMGADFDVDKLYTHSYNYKVVTGGRLEKINYTDSTFDKLSKEQLQNMSMDITYSILSNEKVQNEYQFTYTDDPTLGNDKDAINKIRPAKTNLRTKPEQSSIIYDEFQSHMVEVNAAGKIGVGAYSSASANNILFQYAGVYLKMPTNSKGEIQPDKIVTVKFTDEKGNLYNDSATDDNRVNDKAKVTYANAPSEGAWRLDKVKTFTGRLISDVIKSYQSASVDNAKDQNLYDLHQNKGTFSVSWLIARAGFDERFIDRFITQPIIVKYVKRLNDLDKFTDSKFVPNKKALLQKEMFKELGFDLEKWSYGISGMSLAQMEEAIANDGADNTFQAKILYNFIKYGEVASEVSKAQTAINSDTAFLGKSLYESILKLQDVDKVRYNKLTHLGNTSNLLDNTTQEGAVDYGLEASVDLFANNNLFPLRSDIITDIFNTITAELDRDINSEVAHIIFSDIRASLYTQAIQDVYGRDINELRTELLLGTKEKESLAKRLKNIQVTTTNPFLKTLTVSTANKVGEPDVIEFFSSKDLKEDLTTNMLLGWNELLNAPEGSDENILGEELVMYSLITGNQRTARDFGRFIPYDYISKKLAKYYRSIDFDNSSSQTDLLGANFVTQWFQHNPYKAREIGSANIASQAMSDGKKVKSGIAPDVIVLKGITDENTASLYEYENEDKEHPDYISYKVDKDIHLYKRVDDKYVKIPVLGFSQRLIKEYDLTQSNAQSIFRDVTKQPAPQVVIPQTQLQFRDKTIFEQYNFYKGKKAVLESIVKNSENDIFKAVAQFYLDNYTLVDSYILEKFVDEKHANLTRFGNTVRGFTVRKGTNGSDTGAIVLNEEKYTSNTDFERTFLHELTHAFLFEKLGDDSFTNKELQNIANRLLKHKQYFYDVEWLKKIGVTKIGKIKGETNSDKYVYADYIFKDGKVDTQEFAAFMMSDPDFQKILQNIPFEPDKSFWDAIVEFVTKVLGFNIGDNYLTEGISAVLRIINDNVVVDKSDDIYSQLGNKTQSEHVRILSWEYLTDAKKAIQEENVINSAQIISTRIQDTNEHFGNPFSHKFGNSLIKTDTIKEAVENYIDWILNGSGNFGFEGTKRLEVEEFNKLKKLESRRNWIIKQLNSGELKGKPILYYKELGEPSHATALDYLINKYGGVVESNETINVYSTDNNGFKTLSNLLNGPVKEVVDGKEIEFKTVEHAYQAKKAIFAGDKVTANKIHQSVTGWDAQKLGREIKNLDTKSWDAIAYQELEKSMRLAFEQNPKAMQLLLSTGNSILTHKAKFNLGRWERDFPEILMKIRDGVVTPQKEIKTDNTIKFPDGIKISTGTIKLNQQQEDALIAMAKFVSDKDTKTFALKGYAGTGKTTILNVLRDYIQEKSRFKRVVSSSPTHRANSVMKQKGAENVFTLHSLFGLSPEIKLEEFDSRDAKFIQQNKVKIGYGDILIIDESSMINDALYEFVTKSAKIYDAQIIFVGDPAQLKPVKQEHLSKAFSQVEGSYELTKVERTGDNPLLKESMDVRNKTNGGDFSNETALNDKGEGVVFTNSYESFLEAAFKEFNSPEFKTNPLLLRMLAASNAIVNELNTRIRRGLWGKDADNEYNPGEIVMGYSNWKVDYITGEPKLNNSGDYQILDVTETQQNIEGKVFKGYTLLIKDLINEKSKPFSAFMISNKTPQEDFMYLGQVFENLVARALSFPKGSKEAAGAWSKLSAFKDSFMTPVDITHNGRTKINTTLKYGYSHTIHKSQGGTYKYSFVHGSSIESAFSSDKEMQTQLKYVGVTRAEKAAFIYSTKTKDFTAALPDMEIKFPQKPAGRSFKVAIINGKYIDDIGTSKTKRDIVNKFFRYRGNKDFNTFGLPYYDYSTGSISKDIALVNKINQLYTGRVVKYNSKKERIEFTDDAGSYNEIFTVTAEPEINLESLFFESGESTEATDESQPLTSYQKFIITKQKQIKILEKRLSERGENKYDLNKKISQLETEIAFLEEKKTDATLEALLFNNLNAVTKALETIDEKVNDNPSTDDLYTLFKNLGELDVYIEGMRDIEDYFSYTSEADKNRIFILDKKINEQRVKYLDQLRTIFTMLANRVGSERFKNIDVETMFAPGVDINFAVREMMNMANSKTMLTRFLHQVIQLAKHKIIEKQRDVVTSIRNWQDKLEKHTGLSGNNLFDIFLQKYSNGDWTGNYIGRYKQEYYDKKGELLKDKKDGKLLQSDIDKWIKANAHTITIEEIESGKSSIFSETEMKQQAARIENFDLKRESREEAYRSIYVMPNGAVDEATVKTKMSAWDAKYSPYVYLEGLKKGDTAGSRGYIYLIPEKPKNEWMDKRFDRIANDPMLLEFYNFMIETFAENNSVLPTVTRLPGNYLPEAGKAFMEKMHTDGMLDAFMGLGSAFYDALTDNVEGEIDYNITIKNRTFKSIPTRMMANKLTAKEKSKDIFKILTAHTAMANSYIHKSQVEPILTSGQQLLDEMEEVTERDTVTGEVITKDAWGQKKTVGGKLVNTKLQLEHQVEVFLYDNFRDTEGRIGKPILSDEDKKELERLTELYKTGELTKKEYDTRVSTLGRQVTVTGIADVITKYTYLKALGLPNFMTPTVNLTFGLASNLTYAAGGIGTNLTDMRNAINMFMGAIINKGELRKIAAFMEQLGILNEYNESLYGTDATIVDNLAFFLQNKTERINRGTLMLAHLLSAKVKNKDGNEVSLYHAYKEVDGKLIWDTDNFGEMQVPESGRIGEHGVNMFKFKTYITRVNQKVHGDYDSALRGKRTVMGRALFMFKTWMGMAVLDRFGKEDYDDELEQSVKGRYLVAWTAKDMQGNPIKTKDFMKLLAKAAFSPKGLSELSELDRALVKRNLKEIQIIVEFTIALAALTLVAGGTDDDDKLKFALNSAINILTKAQADLALFTNPNALSSLASNVMPVMSSVQSVFKVVPVVWKTVSGDPTYQNGLLKDQNRLLMWGVEVTPFVSPAMRIWKNGERVIENF